MASFDPTIPDSNASQFFSDVRQGPRLTSTSAVGIEGIGKAFSEGVKGLDQFMENRITNLAKTGADAISDFSNAAAQAFLNPQGVADAAANGIPIPDAINEGLSKASDLTNAKGLGKLNNVNYEAQFDLLARNLRSQFPGYRDFIDKEMNELVGRTPANNLHRGLDAMLQQLGSADTDAAHLEWAKRQQLEHNGYFTPEQQEALQNGDRQKAIMLLDRSIGETAAKNQVRKNAEADIKIAEGDIKLQQEKAKIALSTAFQQVEDNVWGSAMSTPEGQELRKLIDQYTSAGSAMAGQKLPQAAIEKMMGDAMIIRNQYAGAFQQTALQFKKNYPGIDIDDHIAKNIDEKLKYFDNFFTGIQAGHLDLAKYKMAMAQSDKADAWLGVAHRDEVLRSLSGLETGLGQQIMNASIVVTGNDEVGRRLHNITVPAITGIGAVPETLDRNAANLHQLGFNDPESFRKQRDVATTIALNPDTPEKPQRQAYYNTYVNASGYVSQFSAKDQLGAYTGLYSDKNLQGIEQLKAEGKLRPEDLSGTNRQFLNVTSALLNTRLQTFEDVQKAGHGEVLFDTKSKQFVVKNKPVDTSSLEDAMNQDAMPGLLEGLRGLHGLVTHKVDYSIAEKSKDEANYILDTVKSYAKRTGQDADTMLRNLGVPLDKEEK